MAALRVSLNPRRRWSSASLPRVSSASQHSGHSTPSHQPLVNNMHLDLTLVEAKISQKGLDIVTLCSKYNRVLTLENISQGIDLSNVTLSRSMDCDYMLPSSPENGPRTPRTPRDPLPPRTSALAARLMILRRNSLPAD